MIGAGASRTRSCGPGHIALLLNSLIGGGVQRSTLKLADEFVRRGLHVDLVLAKDEEGPSTRWIPADVRTVRLTRSSLWRGRYLALKADHTGAHIAIRPVIVSPKPPNALAYLSSLTAYLDRAQPDALITAEPYFNIVGIWARGLAGASTRLVVTEHNTLSSRLDLHRHRRRWRWRYLPPLIARLYPRADAVVAVSRGVGADLTALAGLPPQAVTTIYNPVVGPELVQAARAPLDHSWFAPDAPPVLLGVGRLSAAKDFSTLIRAFARVRQDREARLIILGEGRERVVLERLVRELQLSDAVALPGFVDNPAAYMARARVFVLSSAYEGFAIVVAEALACGCPVVSTDCAHGPAEILDGGRYGALVPVGDHEALARAVLRTLDDPPEHGLLRARADAFTVDRAAERYLELLEITGASPVPPPTGAVDPPSAAVGSPTGQENA